jgi:tetratricopeptide (TPR) repeat protein
MSPALGAPCLIDAPGDPAAVRSGRLAELSQRVDAWVESVGHVTAVNILAGLVEGRSNRGAFEILRHTHRGGLGVSTTAAPGYWRFQVNFGRHLVERGINGNDIGANECYEALHAGQLDHIQPDDGFRMLLRAAYRGDCFDARAHLALAHLHRGECDRALEAADGFIQEAVSERYCLPILDAAISFGIVCSRRGSGPRLNAEALYPAPGASAMNHGARISVLSATWAFKARDAEAEQMLAEAEKIGERLRLGLVLAEARAAIGFFEFERGNLAAALPPLTWACKTFARAEQRATLLPALLDLVLVAAKAREMTVCQEAITNIEAELDRFPGFLPRYYHRLGYAFVQTGQLDKAREALSSSAKRARPRGTPGPWVSQSRSKR